MIGRTTIRRINVILFVITFALRSYTDAVYESNGIHGGMIVNLKYVTLLLGITFCLLQLWNRKKNQVKYDVVFRKESHYVAAAMISIFTLSLFESLFHTGIDATSQMISELIKLILPILYAYLVLNTFDYEDIYWSMTFVLFFSILGYVLEIGSNAFTLANIQRINFSTSYSPFESHYAAGSAIAMCTFFMYYRKNRILEIISFLFAIATFKRSAVVFAILIFVLPMVFDMSAPVKKKNVNAFKCAFILSTCFYYWIQLPSNVNLFEKILKIDADVFTMGRSGYITKLISSGFTSTGLGSTTLFIGKSIEMDLIKIMLEVGIVGLAIFVWCYFECAGRTRYSLLYMVFVFFNLLTSHSLTNAFSWILIFVILGTMNYKEPKDISKYNRRQQRGGKCT